MILKCKINVTRIDKAHLFKGEKGTYLDISLLENRDGTDSYGNDGMIVQDISKLDREVGKKGAILGNFRIMRSKSAPAKPAATPSAPVAGDGPPEEDPAVPF